MSSYLTLDVPIAARPLPRTAPILKANVEIAVAAVLLVLTLPLLLVLIVAIRLTSAGPAIYRSERLGVGGRRFECLKLRTMSVEADVALAQLVDSDPEIAREYRETRKLAKDPRVTWLGRFLRISSLDELPQLLHVVRGEMSLIGPRPKLPVEQVDYGAHLTEVLTVRPGLTGLWQVSGRNLLTFEERIALDLHYVRTRNAALDLWIVMRTVAVLVFPRAHGAR